MNATAKQSRDTLYFNAFTEDLFSWDNDLENDRERVLKLNTDSRFFAGLDELEMDNRIRPLLDRYADFDFRHRYDDGRRDRQRGSELLARGAERRASTDDGGRHQGLRGEENIFIWCFFLAIVQLALDGAEAYKWVKYIYIDDPISSLDDHNAIVGRRTTWRSCCREAAEPAQDGDLDAPRAVLQRAVQRAARTKANRVLPQAETRPSDGYLAARQTGDTPFFHHVATLVELLRGGAESARLYTHHFNMLRAILEKTASFPRLRRLLSVHQDGGGRRRTASCTQRLINLLSHGNYSLYEPTEMLDENKEHFRKILDELHRAVTRSTRACCQSRRRTSRHHDRATTRNNSARPSGTSPTSCAGR